MKPVATPVAPGGASARDHEKLVVATGTRSGATMAIAIHSTALGPALGGLRLWRYESDEDGVADALRLAHGMTFKAAAAGLGLGGGKGVICSPGGEAPIGAERTALLLDFADLVESLDGRYITAEDVGTSTEDMVVIATRTRHVTGLPVEHGGAGDPSPFTALGVQAAMRAAAAMVFGVSELAGRTVAIAGLGHVGATLARNLDEAGAELIVSDVDEGKRALAECMGWTWAEPGSVLETDCDIVSPCAVGGAIHAGNVDRLRCRVVCGAANNQLADEGFADALAERGVLFAPDFIANAGGLINVYRELRSYTKERARELSLGIEGTMGRILQQAATRGVTPLAAARELAVERLDRAPARTHSAHAA